jgi:AcrR family transcriptional regulator
VGRPREHGPQTRLALLDAAEALVARGGLEALSVRAVAEEIGSSVRAVYSVFGSKEGLIRGLAVRGFELLMEEVDSVPITADPTADLAGAAIKGFRPFALRHPDLFRLIFVGSRVDLGTGAGEASANAFGRLAARLEHAREARIVPDRPINELGLEFHALCQGLASVELCGLVSTTQADQMWTDSLKDLLAGWQGAATAPRGTAAQPGPQTRAARPSRRRATPGVP